MTKRSGKAALLYFVIHFIVEVICFFMMYRIVGDSVVVAIAATIYNAVAFVPQILFGSLRDLTPKFKPGIIGVPLLLAGFILYFVTNATGFIFWLSLIILCTGNALLHVSGAELTLRTAGGKLSPVAIFVSGGSFGLITGQLLAKTNISFLWIVLLGIIMFPLVILGETLYKGNPKENDNCEGFNYTFSKRATGAIIAAAFVIVTVRSYLGYGIPTSWKKTVIQTVILYVFLGIGNR